MALTAALLLICLVGGARAQFAGRGNCYYNGLINVGTMEDEECCHAALILISTGAFSSNMGSVVKECFATEEVGGCIGDGGAETNRPNAAAFQWAETYLCIEERVTL